MSIYKDILSLIPKELRVRSFVVLVLVFIGMVLEMLGVSLIIPIFSLILNSENSNFAQFLNFLPESLYPESTTELIYLSLSALILIYLLKAIYLSFLSFVQSRFVFSLQANISNRLFETYLKQPYTFHLNSNSAYLIRNVTTETQVLVEATFISFMLIVNELVVITGLVILMFFLTPLKASILLGIVLLGGLIIQILSKDLLLKWGEVRQNNEGKKIKSAQEGLGGIKDVLVLNRKDEILNKFSNSVNSATKASANRYAVQQFPRLWIEVLGIIALMIMILIDLLQGVPSVELISGVAFIAAIAFRIMPSSNRFLSSIQSIKFSTPIVRLLKNELSIERESQNSSKEIPFIFEDNIIIKDLCFGYDAKNLIINNLSLEIQKGMNLGIVGTSGAGKSTFVDLILGLHEPSSGIFTIDGIDLFSNLRGWQAIIGYVPQNIFLSDDTLRRNIAFGLADEDINENDIDYAINLSQLGDLVSNLDDGVDTLMGERGVRLSGGQKQRIGIARALYQRPKILILDEATSSLDLETEADVMKSIYSLDKSITIIIIAHRLSTLDNCDRIVTLSNGKVQ